MKKHFVLMIFLLPLHSLYPMEQAAIHPIEDEIMKASSKSNPTCFKPLLELKKNPDIIGTENEQLIKRTLVQCMGELFPSNSLKECCAKKYWLATLSAYQGDLSRDCPLDIMQQQIDTLQKKLPADLLEYLKALPNDVPTTIPHFAIHDKKELPSFIKLSIISYPKPSEPTKRNAAASLYEALMKDDEEKLFRSFISVDNKYKISFLETIVRMTENWNIVSRLITTIEPSVTQLKEQRILKVLKRKNDAGKDHREDEELLKKYLFIKTVDSGNLLLAKKFILNVNLDFDSYEFKCWLNGHILRRKNPAIMVLLQAAGILEQQLTSEPTLLSFALTYSDYNYHDSTLCINYLRKLQEEGFRFSLEQESEYTSLEKALLKRDISDSSLAPLNFISFILSEASKQEVKLETLITNLKKVSPYTDQCKQAWNNLYDFTLWKLISYCIVRHERLHENVTKEERDLNDPENILPQTIRESNVKEARTALALYETSIGCLNQLMQLGSPSIKTYKDSNNKTLLDCLKENKRLSQHAELVALLTP